MRGDREMGVRSGEVVARLRGEEVADEVITVSIGAGDGIRGNSGINVTPYGSESHLAILFFSRSRAAAHSSRDGKATGWPPKLANEIVLGSRLSHEFQHVTG